MSASGSIATIGTNGVVTGIGAGTSLISYIMPTGCITTAPLTVKLLSPVTGPSSVCVGQSITLSNATGGGTWSTSAPSVANVIAGNGIITGLAGNLVAPVTYNLGSGCKAIFNVTVNPLPAIGGVTSVCQGLTTTLTNTAVGGTWSSANSSIATIGTSGIVSALNPGLVNISYVLPSGCTSSTRVNVNPVAAIGGPTRVCQGQTMTLTNSLAGTWSSGAISVATIGTNGLVTGLATNSATAPITYTFCTGCKATLTVSVLPLSPIVGVTSVCQGQVITLTDASAGGTWSSSATGIATFASSNGNVTGVSTGAATISYALASGCTATFNVTVNPLLPITGPSSLCNGQSITLANATPGGGTWASASSTIATVSTGGVVTGVTVLNLTAIISYTTPLGCRAIKTVTVNAVPTVASLIGGPFAVAVSGAPITLTNTTTGGVWSSSNVAKATIGVSTGVVTGVSVGSAIMTYLVTNAAGCSAYVTKAITVGPTAAPGNISTNMLTMNVGANLEMNETIKNGYWTCSDCEGIVELNSGNGSISGIGEGRAIITYTVTNEENTSLSVTKVIVNPKTDMVNNTAITFTSITLMPNPNKGEFTIIGTTSNLASEAINFEVVDMLGQIIYRGQTKAIDGKLEERVQLNNSLANGMYLLNLHSSGEHYVIHFVVER